MDKDVRKLLRKAGLECHVLCSKGAEDKDEDLEVLAGEAAVAIDDLLNLLHMRNNPPIPWKT